MLIGQFCKVTGLARDTVRFYVKLGLLKPDIGSAEGNRYQVFNAKEVERAKMIRIAQRLGFTLKEIAELADMYEGNELGSDAKADVLRQQITRLAQQEQDLRTLQRYLQAKLAWVESGSMGLPPTMQAVVAMQKQPTTQNQLKQFRNGTGTTPDLAR